MKRTKKLLAAMSAGLLWLMRSAAASAAVPWFLIPGLIGLIYGLATGFPGCENSETDSSSTSTSSGTAGDGGSGAGGGQTVGGSSGEGGSGATGGNPTTSSGTAGNGGTGGSGGGSDCYPGSDPTDPNCKNAASCACAIMLGMPSDAPCPGTDNVENSCKPGHNTCGCDIEPDEEYIPPDPIVLQFLDGDIWEDKDGNQASVTAKTEINNQTTVHILVAPFGSDSDYYDGLTVRGFEVRWNRKNAELMESGEGEFSADGKMLTVRFYDAGSGTPYSTQTATLLAPN